MSNGMMFHRTSSAAVHKPTTTNTDNTLQRRRKRMSSSSYYYTGKSTGMYNKHDLLIAIGGTAVLTVVFLILLLNIYTFISNVSLFDSGIWNFYTHRHHSRYDDGEVDDRHIRRNRHGTDDWYEESKLPWNTKYIVPNSIEIVGDRSDTYVELRKRVDQDLPENAERSLEYVNKEIIQNHPFTNIPYASMDIHHSDQVPYDINDCPATPPVGYPYQWNITTILNNWSPDDTNPPSQIHHALCIFDYTLDYEKALTYRNAELPFVIVNDPQVAATVERWNRPNYLLNLLGSEPHRCEYSPNNHFMYYTPVSKKKKNRRLPQKRRGQNVPEGWEEPTKLLRMPYWKWLQHANVTDDKLGPDNEHWYYRLIGCGMMGNDGSCDSGASEYLFDELPFFQPKQSLYIVDPDEQKGIHCRFGMKGVIAENHFDGSRNAIVVLGGSRRYILAHPDQCENLALYPKGHPSARHSAVDWTNPDYETYPEFNTAVANEVILQPGQVLYLPTEWFHFIVSLELNYQCNSRSGITNHYHDHIQQCGF